MAAIFGPEDFKEVIDDPVTQTAAARAANDFIANYGNVLYGRVETLEGSGEEYLYDFSSDKKTYDNYKIMCIDQIPLSLTERKGRGHPKEDPVTRDDEMRALRNQNRMLRGELEIQRNRDA